MCGINGFNFVNKKILNRMNDSLSHRGPDAGGSYFNDGVSMGHRRLSILDLSKSGSQPMSYVHKTKTATIVFNGEIYNYKEIRNRLQKKGYRFKSNSDTEVILASYLEWGRNCVSRFNGMWAFCIYDSQKQILFLSRDRVGKKPLYYYFDGAHFVFSSEIKGILQHNLKPELNKDSIDFYFSMGFIPAPYSIYKNIQKLEQRQSLIFNLRKKSIKKEFYYEWPKFNPEWNKRKLKGEFYNLINDSIRLRMVSDVPLGSFLSGGLDSSTIVNFAKNYDDKLNTYSIGFGGRYDETPYIDITKNYFKTNHHHKYYTENIFKKQLKNIFYYYDEPFSDPSMFPTEFLAKFAKTDLTVSLSGDGGDEIFGGYPRYKYAMQLTILRKIPKLIRNVFRYLPFLKLREGIRLSFLPKEMFYSEARKSFYKPIVVKTLLRKQLLKSLKKTSENLVEAVRLMDIEFYTLPDNFLTKVDRASMANSLEVRCPFLDYRLIEYSMKLPTKYKISLLKEKGFFRSIIKDFLPPKILNKKKQGFTPPINDWITKQEYKKEIDTALTKLKGTLSMEWIDFYKKEILPHNSLVHNNYKIRLFLFYRWYKYWILSPKSHLKSS